MPASSFAFCIVAGSLVALQESFQNSVRAYAANRVVAVSCFQSDCRSFCHKRNSKFI